MSDKLVELLRQIEDAQIELSEIRECGTLEEQIEAVFRVEQLQQEYLTLCKGSFNKMLLF